MFLMNIVQACLKEDGHYFVLVSSKLSKHAKKQSSQTEIQYGPVATYGHFRGTCFHRQQQGVPHHHTSHIVLMELFHEYTWIWIAQKSWEHLHESGDFVVNQFAGFKNFWPCLSSVGRFHRRVPWFHLTFFCLFQNELILFKVLFPCLQTLRNPNINQLTAKYSPCANFGIFHIPGPWCNDFLLLYGAWKNTWDF